MKKNLALVLKIHPPAATCSFNVLGPDKPFSILDNAESLQTAMDQSNNYNIESNNYLNFKRIVLEQWRNVIVEQMKLFATCP